MDLMVLTCKIPWFGAHSGYDQLPRHLQMLRMPHGVIHAQTLDLDAHYVPPAGGLSRGSAQSWATRWERLFRAIRTQQIVHVLYLEKARYLCDFWMKAPTNMVATLHHPPAESRRLRLGFPRYLRSLSSAIVLYRRDLALFESYVGRGRVRFIRHGVDTDFFRPAGRPGERARQLLFVGEHGRNTAMLYRIVTRLAKRHPDLRVALVVRHEARRRSVWLRRLAHHPAVVWHEGVSDQALRRLYQQSLLAFIPMNECAAANAVVETLACGLPLVTTDVGGIRDYGGGSVYPVVRNHDDAAMLELIEGYLDAPEWREAVAARCRQFAERFLAWPLIAQEHVEAYRALTGR